MSHVEAQISAPLDEELAERIELSDAEVERLVEILDGGFSLTPALRKALSRLASPKRRPPRLRWLPRAD